ncbi:MAG: leucyl aminopeptidase [Candidatus Berkiellales bacterium]
MEFTIKSEDPTQLKTGCLIAGIYEPKKLGTIGAQLDKSSKGMISQHLKQGDCNGKLGQVLLLPQAGQTKRILLIGLGPKEKFGDIAFRDMILKIITTLNETGTTDAALFLEDLTVKDRDNFWKIRQAIQHITSALYQFTQFKTQNIASPGPLEQIVLMVPHRELAKAKQSMNEAVAIAKGMNLTKNLANLPANICTPSYLANQAKAFAKKHRKIKTTVLTEKQMVALKMGLLLSVTQGSTSSAQFITLEYHGAAKKDQPIVLVGKGITFDTGGNTIKIPPNMIGMKYDMSGAATVFGVLEAAVTLKLPLNIIGVIPTCENMPGPNATRPGDIIKSMAGLTVEILNTDAEGRLILADALTYCERFHPEVVIDIATLTGACMLALGPYASGLMSNHAPLTQALLKASAESGDKAWELPLWNEYHDALKSECADITNVPINDIGARTIVAGCFLAKFATKFHWAHLDVANTACQFTGAKTASARPVPMLMQYLLNRCG